MPSFRFSFQGNIRQNHPFGKPTLFRIFLNLCFGEPMFCTLDSRGFRHFRAFRDFRKSSNQPPCLCLSGLSSSFINFRDSRRFREKHRIAKHRFGKTYGRFSDSFLTFFRHFLSFCHDSVFFWAVQRWPVTIIGRVVTRESNLEAPFAY